MTQTTAPTEEDWKRFVEMRKQFERCNDVLSPDEQALMRIAIQAVGSVSPEQVASWINQALGLRA